MPDLDSFIKELLDRKKVDNYILELSERVTSESALKELLLLARETDQLTRVLSTKNSKQVEISCGEILQTIFLASKKDYLHNPGRRFIKALSAEATRRIQEAGNKLALESEFQGKNNDWESRRLLSCSAQGQEIYRCPSCMSIRISKEDLGGKCPRCFEKLPSDLRPSYRVKENALGGRRAKADFEIPEKKEVRQAQKGREVYRCPSCMSIKISREDLGGKCPQCFEKLPSDLAPSYRVKENAFGRTSPNADRKNRAKNDDGGLIKRNLICSSCGSKKMRIDQVNAGRLLCDKCGSERLEYQEKTKKLRANLGRTTKRLLLSALPNKTSKKIIHGILIVSTIAIGLGIAYKNYEERDRSTIKRYCASYPSDDCALISRTGRLWGKTPGLPLKRTSVRFAIHDKGDTKIAQRKDGKGRYLCLNQGLESGKGYECTRDGWTPNLKYNYLSEIRQSISTLSQKLCNPSLIEQYKVLSLYTRHNSFNWYAEVIEPHINLVYAGFLSQDLSEEEKRIGITRAERNRVALDALNREKRKIKDCLESGSQY